MNLKTLLLLLILLMFLPYRPLQGTPLMIVVYSIGGDGTFSFDISGIPVSIITVNGTGNQTLSLPSGDYTITQQHDGHWMLVTAWCDMPTLSTEPGSLELDLRYPTICTFTYQVVISEYPTWDSGALLLFLALMVMILTLMVKRKVLSDKETYIQDLAKDQG